MSPEIYRFVDNSANFVYIYIGDSMELKEKILAILGESDEPVSGEALAEMNNVSRNAVWKAVNELRKDGFLIEAATNRGYVLARENKKLVGTQVSHFMKKCRNVAVFETLPSTNKTAKDFAEQGAEEGFIVVAESQTAGRGRLGRSFFSPTGGLYFSVILRPCFNAQVSILATVAAAVATARVLERHSRRTAEIKWVNDIYMANRKVCGILTEGSFNAETAKLDYAVLGIGINLFVPQEGFPQDIANIAGAVFSEKEVTSLKKAQIIAEITDEFFALYEDIENRSFLEEYRRRSWLQGKEVYYERNGTINYGTVVGIDDEARLLVMQNGIETAIGAGEVSVRSAGEKNEQ